MNHLSEQLLQELYREQYGNQANLIRELDARQGIVRVEKHLDPLAAAVIENEHVRMRRKHQRFKKTRKAA